MFITKAMSKPVTLPGSMDLPDRAETSTFWLIGEREARQQIWLCGRKCELAYIYIYIIYVCNASGIQ